MTGGTDALLGNAGTCSGVLHHAPDQLGSDSVCAGNWQASIYNKGRVVSLGTYASEEEVDLCAPC